MLIEEIILLLIMLMLLINHLYFGSHDLYDDLLESGWLSEPYIKSDKISQDVEFDYEVVDSERDIDFNIEPTQEFTVLEGNKGSGFKWYFQVDWSGRIKSINMIGIPPGMSLEEAMVDLKRQLYDYQYRQRRVEQNAYRRFQ